MPSAREVAEQRAGELQNRAAADPLFRRPTMTAAAVDRTTGRVYQADSGAPLPTEEEVAEAMRFRMPEPLLQPEKRWPVQNCAEFKAANAALWDGARMEDLEIHAVRVATGRPAPRCANCRVTTAGAIVTSDAQASTE